MSARPRDPTRDPETVEVPRELFFTWLNALEPFSRDTRTYVPQARWNQEPNEEHLAAAHREMQEIAERLPGSPFDTLEESDG